jgi:hypothetical protein
MARRGMRGGGSGATGGVAIVALAASLLAAGCSSTPAPAIARDCGDVFNAVRCQVMTDYVAWQLGTTREQVSGLVVLPEPTPEIIDGHTILQVRSGGSPVDVEVTLRDGSVHRVTLNCGGIPAIQCQDDPQLEASSVTHGGYYDGTEADITGGRPSIAPDALADAVPLRIARLDIPIDHTGLNEIPIGEARLPNGILTAADFALVEPWPTGVSILDGGVRLEIRSLDDEGKAITNIYEHGWRPGTERVQAVLVFDVAQFDPGATLGIRDVDVR